MTKKRLLCYLAITFVLTWVPMFLFLGLGGVYDSETPETSLLCMYAMLCPATAVLLTRKLTGEGFSLTGENSLMLGMHFKNKKWIWYAAAFVIPLLYWAISDAVWFAFVPQSFDASGLQKMGVSNWVFLSFPLAGAVNAITISFGALGEEIGWRTYLYPKLEELFGLKKALLIGGIIWGVWHFPLVAVGHIGTGYWGEPYTGFLVFTIDTIATGSLMYLVAKKSGSVWPAVFMHAFHNTGANVFMLFLNTEGLETPLFKLAQVSVAVIGECVLAVWACWAMRNCYPINTKNRKNLLSVIDILKREPYNNDIDEKSSGESYR